MTDTPWAVVDEWRAWLRAAGLSRNTIRTRVGHIRLLQHMTQARSPYEFTTPYLVAVMGGQDWSVEHRRAMKTSLTQFYGFLEKMGKMPGNPALGLPRVAQAKAAPRPAPDWVVAAARRGAGPRELLMIRLALAAGLRRAEIAGLHRDDVVREGRSAGVGVVGALAEASVRHAGVRWDAQHQGGAGVPGARLADHDAAVHGAHDG